jgi:pyruvate ferredoxin oxidoreductase beta subunit
VATLSAHDPVDLAEKVRRAADLKGPRMFLGLAVCPTGWGFDPARGPEIAKLAVETGIWPLKEARDGRVRHTYVPNKFRPVTEYLELQRRFRHLFRPTRRDDVLEKIQANVDAYWRAALADEPSSEEAR